MSQQVHTIFKEVSPYPKQVATYIHKCPQVADKYSPFNNKGAPIHKK